MTAVLEVLAGLEGKSNNVSNLDNVNKKSPMFTFAEKVFKLMDDDNDGEINVDEFVKGYQKLRARQNSQAVTVTASITVRPKDKSKPKSAIDVGPGDKIKKKEPTEKAEGRSRRKSLRDGGKVKSLFKPGEDDRI